MTENDKFAVEVHGLTKVFGTGETRVEAIGGIDLTITEGEFVAVMGPSGSGKSTLLHLIGGLDEPTSGRIIVGGDDFSTLDDDALTMIRRRRIGFVFQAFNLITVLTAEENVALPLVLDGMDEIEAHKRATAALKRTGLTDRGSHVPAELSGGEQQRVALSRSLVNEPLLLLADEPTGNLDSATSDQIMSLLRRLVDDQDQTILMVTHNARHAAMADRIITLRDGRIVEQQSLKNGRSADQVLADLESAL
ncbi:MAG: ABC transporter ATP-binding protein [Phycisphaerales bacterium]|nr:ABC transporter ATP-binding protein [Phycisphaerales bacterium]